MANTGTMTINALDPGELVVYTAFPLWDLNQFAQLRIL